MNEESKYDERSARLLATMQWWDADRPLASAQDWLLLHRLQARGVRVNQWESLRRMGEDAATPGNYRQAVERGLSRKKADGQLEPRWPSAFLKDLLAEIEAVSVPDSSPARAELERQLKHFEPEMAEGLRNQIAVAQARTFVDALVTRIKAERALEGDQS